MNIIERIEKEINDNSPEEQKEELIKFLHSCRYLSQWNAFTVCHWKKIGINSYDGVRVWTFRK